MILFHPIATQKPDTHVGTEFIKHLPASTTRRSRIQLVCHHNSICKGMVAIGHSGTNRTPFRALGQTITGIFNIATGNDIAVAC